MAMLALLVASKRQIHLDRFDRHALETFCAGAGQAFLELIHIYGLPSASCTILGSDADFTAAQAPGSALRPTRNANARAGPHLVANPVTQPNH